MKKTIAVLMTLALLCAALTPALAEGAIKRIGTLQMLNMSEAEYASIQKLRAVAGDMLNEEDVPAENPYTEDMLDADPEIVYFDSLNDMVMALEANQIDAIDLNRTTAEYLCANTEGLTILMDYESHVGSVLTDLLFNSLMSFDFSLMLPEGSQELNDAITAALSDMEDEGVLSALAETYIDGAVSGEVPAAELPAIEGGETLRVAVTGDLPPMDYVTADGRPAGYNVAVLAELSQRLGVNIELVPITASARAMALASNQVDAVFWSRGCMEAMEIVDGNLSWREQFVPDGDVDVEELDRIDRALMSVFDYAGYAGKDIPEGLAITGKYFTDSIVLVAKQ